MNRNSAYFRGTIAKIVGRLSSATFDKCNFNNNNGLAGGLFYVDRRSQIRVSNSKIFSNFAITASIAYVSTQGSIVIDKCDIFSNKAISIGAIEIVDSGVSSIIQGSSLYMNELITKAVTIKELSDPEVCINLCTSSIGYQNYLNKNRNVLDDVVGKSSFIIIGNTFNNLNH